MGVVYTKVIFLVGACSHKSVNNHLLCVYLCVCGGGDEGEGGGKCSHLLYTCVCVCVEGGRGVSAASCCVFMCGGESESCLLCVYVCA